MIDTSAWKEFRVGDLLIDESLCVYGHNKKWTENEKPTDKSLPVISGITVNNGIYYYTDDIPNKDEVFEDCLTITTRGEYSGTLFYHKGKFVLANNILTLPFANTNELTSLFLKVSIEKLGYGGYDNYPRKEVLVNDRIKLPVTPDGQPDWDYMESYMKDVMEESEKALSNLKKADDTKHLIDVSGWGEFDIAKLFDMSLPKGDLQVKKVDDGDIPLITPSNFNNGMLQRISKYSPSTLYDKGSLTVDMFGNAYYQEEDFFVTAHGHVNVLLSKMPLNIYTGSFLASAIRTMFFDKYGFNEMCTQKVLKAESIWLPITSTGEPDWQYMEDYMKNIMNKQEMAADNLSKIA